ncbi:hypothetical protein ACO0E1_16305 [Curtobacterium sp. RRHDQ66]|uniref:hypothetical protein n=1 Tax=Curtobacterium guangdongense TaxID=3413380 RepID=UPI003BEF7C74
MTDGFDVVLDRRPNAIGLDARDWAGMQVTRVWSAPLFEADAATGHYRAIAATAIRRLDELEWIIDVDAERVGSAQRVLADWRWNSRKRGVASFFFLARAVAVGRTALRITTRAPYADVRPFLDAFDLWIGLRAASAASVGRERGPFCDRYELADGAEVRVLSQAAAAHISTGRRWTAAGVPASSRFSQAISTTLLTFITVPVGSRHRLVEVPKRALKDELAACPSAGGAFQLLDDPIVHVQRSASPTLLQYSPFRPNQEVAKAICSAAAADLAEMPLTPGTIPYREDADQMFGAGLALTVAVPMNSATTGLTRTLAMTPWVARSGLVPRQALAVALRREEQTPRWDAQAARSILGSSAGVGSLARYVAGRSNNHGWDAPVSALGILPLDELETR